MANDFHIDLLTGYSGGDITTDPVRVKSGANALVIYAPSLDGGTLQLQYRPYTADDSGQWYSRATGTFLQGDLDAENKIWINTLIGEGEVRAVLTGTAGGAASIIEMKLRPTHETEIELL